MSSPGVAGSRGERDGVEEEGKWEGTNGQTEERYGKETLWANEGSGINIVESSPKKKKPQENTTVNI